MNIAGFYNESITNGEGWRAVLFVSGCPHQCEGCHNPNTWSGNYGVSYHEDEIFKKIMENPYVDGLTLSGGEPLLYYKQLTPLLLRVREQGFNIWCYTGYTFEYLYEQSIHNTKLKCFLKLIDVLVDGKFVIAEKNSRLRFCGSTNQRIINVKDSMQHGHPILQDVAS